ncbi:MAG: hypothetical protein ACOC8E_07945, partial [Planctomycetota bacterium]
PRPISGFAAEIEGTADSFAIIEASGRYGTTLLTGSCRSLRSGSSHALAVRAGVRDFKPGSDLLALLPANMRQAWNALNLADGRMDVNAEARLPLVRSPSGRTVRRPEFFRVLLSARGCSMRPTWFPYSLSRVGGELSIGLDEILFTTPLVGWHGGGNLRVSGSIGLSKRSRGSELLIEANDLAVDRELHAALERLDAGTAEWRKTCSVEGGTVDASFMLKGFFTRDAERDWALRLRLDGNSALYKPFPYKLDELRGQVAVSPGKLRFNQLEATHGQATVRLSGWMDTSAESRALSLKIHATEVGLDQDLVSALGPELRRRWRRLGLSGNANVDLVLSTPKRKDRKVDARAVVELSGCTARVPVGNGRSLPLAHLSGRLRSAGDVVRLQGLTARCLGGRVKLDGTVVRVGDLTKIDATLSGQNLSVGQMAALLPDERLETVRLLQPAGKITVRGCTIDVVHRPGREPDVAYDYTVDLQDGGLSIPMSRRPEKGEKGKGQRKRLRLSDIAGRLQMSRERGGAAHGRFQFDRVRLPYGVLRNTTGRIRRTGAMFFLDDVRARMYGGDVEASFRGAQHLLFFTGHARATGIDVARLCREAGITEERVWGELNAAVRVTGERLDEKGKKPTWRLGGWGTARIDRANLGKTPLVKSIISYRELLLDHEPIVEAAETSFTITRDRLEVDKLLLKGPSVSTRGVGWIELTDDLKLDLYFYRKTEGGLLPDLPLVKLLGDGLNWVIDQISNQIVVVHIGGTIKRPTASPAVLKELGDQLKRYIILNVKEEEGWTPQKQQTPEKDKEAPEE